MKQETAKFRAEKEAEGLEEDAIEAACEVFQESLETAIKKEKDERNEARKAGGARAAEGPPPQAVQLAPLVVHSVNKEYMAALQAARNAVIDKFGDGITSASPLPVQESSRTETQSWVMVS